MLEEEVVEHVSVVVETDCDTFGLQECICLHVCFTPSHDENPLVWDLH